MRDLVPERLPEDIDAERSLLATLCAPGNEVKAAELSYGLEEEDFIHPAHREIFKAMRSLARDPGAEINALTLKFEISKAGALGKVGDFPGLVEILSADELGRPEVLAQRLRNLSVLRRLIRIGASVAMKASSQMTDPGDIIRNLSLSLADLETGGSHDLIAPGTEIMDLAESGKPFRESAGDRNVWLGIPHFDEAFEGAPGQVIIAAARPGVGKTALMVQGSLETARRGGKPLIISLEMSKAELQARAAAYLTHARVKQFRDGTYDELEVSALSSNLEILENWRVWPKSSGTPWPEIEGVIRYARRVFGIDSVWIDYFTLIRKPDGHKSSTDASRWADLMQSVTRMTKDLGITTVLLSQLRKENAGVEPTDADLRDTGQLEQDAYTIFMLWAASAKSAEEMRDAREVWCKVQKNRQGPAGFKRLLEFDGSRNRFKVIERVTPAHALVPPHQAGLKY